MVKNDTRLRSLGSMFNVIQDCMNTEFEGHFEWLRDQYVDIKFIFKNLKFMFYMKDNDVWIKFGLSSEVDWKVSARLRDLDMSSPHTEKKISKLIKLQFSVCGFDNIILSVDRSGIVVFFDENTEDEA